MTLLQLGRNRVSGGTHARWLLTNDHAAQFKEALTEIHRRWGNEALRPLSALKPQETVIPTGFAALDSLIKGGIPCGRITEINGAPTSGMTTLAMKIIAQAQSQGRIGIYVDLAGVFDPGYAVQCGVQLDGLLIAKPLDTASALDILQIVADAGGAGISVLDHILVIPHSERILGAGLRRLSPALRQSGFTALLLNPGQPSPSLVQHAALRLACANQGWIEKGRDITGCHVRVSILKILRGKADQYVDLEMLLDDAAGEEAA